MANDGIEHEGQRHGSRFGLAALLAIPIGLLLLVLPMEGDPEVQRLTRVAGLAAVLFAFTANAEYGAKKVVFAGAGALCLSLWNLLPASDCSRCYKASIRPIQGARPVKFADRTQIIVIAGDEDLLGTFSRDQDRYTFVLPGDNELIGSKIVFNLTDPQPAGASSPVALFAVQKECLMQHIEQRGYVELYYDPDRGLIFDDIVESQRILADLLGTPAPASCRTEEDPSLFSYARAGLKWLAGFAFVGSAFGESDTQPGASLLLQELQSEDLRVRLRAREMLQAHPEESLRTIVPLLDPTTAEAVQLEVVYVLRDILRVNSSARESIIDLLQPLQRKTLVEMLGAPSRAVRGGTASFLLELRDAAFTPSLERVAFAPSLAWQPRYNAILVLEGVLGDMTSTQAADLKLRINRLAESESEDRLKQLMSQFGERRYFLVVMSFRDEARAIAHAKVLRQKDGFGSVEAHLLNTGLVAVTLPPTTLAGSFAARQIAESAAVAGPDAWLAAERQVARQVYPPT